MSGSIPDTHLKTLEISVGTSDFGQLLFFTITDLNDSSGVIVLKNSVSDVS